MNTKTVLIAGAAGFIGPKVVKLFLTETDFRVLALDKLTYAGNKRNLEMALEEAKAQNAKNIDSRYEFIHGDICDLSVKGLVEAYNVTWLVNLAAESHVDRSIGGAPEFMKTEIQGTLNLLEIIRVVNESSSQIKKVLFVSTDEVYGSIDRKSKCEGEHWYELAMDEPAKIRQHVQEYLFREDQPLHPGSPYASTKAGADLLILSYVNTYGESLIPARITRGCNNFGPFQHPEKLLPLAICTLLKPRMTPNGNRPGYNRCIPIYDRGLAVREWLHTEDHARAMLTVLENGKPGEIYNVGSGQRCLNRDILIAVFKAVDRLCGAEFESLREACFDATGTRPGHDLCYAVDASRLRSLGWEPDNADLDSEVRTLVEWYDNNRDWWEPIWDSLEFENYWQSKYGEKMRQLADGSDRVQFDFYDETHWDRPLSDALL